MKEHPCIDILSSKRGLECISSHAGQGIKHHRGHPRANYGSSRLGIHGHAGELFKTLTVVIHNFALTANQLYDSLHLRTADRSLDVRHLVFEPYRVRPKLFCLTTCTTVIRESEHFVIQFSIIRHQHATFTCGEGFSAMKGKCSKYSHAASPLALVLRSDGFSRIFNHRDAVARTDV